MSNIIEPIGKTNTAKPSPIMVDGKAFKSQRDADDYISKRNAMTPEQLKKEADDIALAKSNQRQDMLIGTLKVTAKISLVPLGLAYFAYYQKYSLTKGIGVVVVGCGVAYFVAIAYAFAGNPFFNNRQSVKVLKQ
jgi:hypothetical protein